jgi:2-polyprenyl-3-methyl-5-hydroxy-6-metoxy-1,4-benzoquinol methylase
LIEENFEMVYCQYRESEIQALIVLGELNDPIETPNNNFYSFYPKNLKQAQTYFRRFALDLIEAFDALVRRELAYKQDDAWYLTKKGQQAARLVRHKRPPIWYWYKDFFTAIENSRAFSLYCERVYGKDLSQHGFSNVDELHWMLDLVKLDETIQLLDIGCGNGRISEYISDKTLARVTGIDYIPEAIAQAKRRTANKQDRLCFQVGNINELESVSKRYNVILSIDSIFFGQDLTTTLANLERLLKPDGEMIIFCGDDLSSALRRNRLAFTVYDRGREHHQHLQLKRRVATGLRKDFEAEGNRFIWENVMAESLDDTNSYDPANCSRPRYLYHIWTQSVN